MWFRRRWKGRRWIPEVKNYSKREWLPEHRFNSQIATLQPHSPCVLGDGAATTQYIQHPFLPVQGTQGPTNIGCRGGCFPSEASSRGSRGPHVHTPVLQVQREQVHWCIFFQGCKSPQVRAASSWIPFSLITSQRHIHNSITMGLRNSTPGFWGNTNIQSITLDICVPFCKIPWQIKLTNIYWANTENKSPC